MGEPLPATLSHTYQSIFFLTLITHIPNLSHAFFCFLAEQTTPWPDADDTDGSGAALGCGT